MDGTVFIANVDHDSGEALLIARFEPPAGFYLYSKDLSMQGVNGVGRPTLVELNESQQALQHGELSTPSPLKLKREGGEIYPHYPAGAVEMALPVRLPQGKAEDNTEIALHLTYMTCEEASGVCLRPVERREIRINIPNSPAGLAGDWALAEMEGPAPKWPLMRATSTSANSKLASGITRNTWRNYAPSSPPLNKPDSQPSWISPAPPASIARS